MSKKHEFKPEISRITLNPEQAVLSCDCYSYGQKAVTSLPHYWTFAERQGACSGKSRGNWAACYNQSAGSSTSVSLTAGSTVS